jgi:propanol-preferring alcohol dehydrogenase
MATMAAYRLLDWQRPARVVEVDIPVAGPGQVLVKVAGVGLCHSDILFLDAPAGMFPYPVPFTLGHEIGGWVHELGPGVTAPAVGTPVVVASRPRCGRCVFCLQGYDNYCEAGTTGLGYGQDGGLASFVVAGTSAVVELRTLDPRHAAPLTDAGKTSYHAVRRVLPKLVPGSTAIVIGVGGLGGYAVQYLRTLSPTRVIAVDAAPHRLALAQRFGVDEAVLVDSGPTAGASMTEALSEVTGGRGAEVILDFVGTDSTIAAALSSARPLGSVGIVGAGGGEARVSWTSVARECDVWIPQGGTQQDLREVIELAEAGLIVLDDELFGFDRVDEAYARLRGGDLNGRAVVTPND